MWAFATQHWVAFIVFVFFLLMTFGSIMTELAKAWGTRGTTHCHTCACRSKIDGNNKDKQGSGTLRQPPD